MRPIHLVIAHHSVTHEHVTVAEVDVMHRARGMARIGYHYLVHRLSPGGPWTVSAGRPVEQIGAHDAGQNEGSIGVCLAGRYDEGRPLDPDGWAVLVATVAHLCRRYGLTADQVEGHCEREPATTATACPGYDPAELRAAVGARIGRAA